MNGSPTSIRAFLDKQSPTTSTTKSPAAVAEVAEDDDYQAYANGRVGARQQLTLTFRKANGAVKSFSYSYLYAIESDDEAQGFLVEVGRTKIVIRGHNLELLYRLLCLHRVQEITEAPRAQAFDSAETAPLVQSIEFQRI